MTSRIDGQPALVVPLAEGIDMAFCAIPAGEFVMGARGQYPDEEPRHLVRISQAFYLGVYPVTQAQFGVWTREQAVEHRNEFDGGPDQPAENLDWWQAMAFCAWLTETREVALPAGYVATLPTEAEWEYACRAGTETEYWSGDGEAALTEVGWYRGNAGDGTHPVGQKRGNVFGLHDMHGKVWEWCWDAYDAEAYKTRVDGVSVPGAAGRLTYRREAVHAREGDASEHPDRVVRGGSWVSSAGDCRSAYRYGGRPGVRNGLQGFRVCLVPGPVRTESGTRGRRETERGGTPSRSRKAHGARRKG